MVVEQQAGSLGDVERGDGSLPMTGDDQHRFRPRPYRLVETAKIRRETIPPMRIGWRRIHEKARTSAMRNVQRGKSFEGVHGWGIQGVVFRVGIPAG